MPEESSFSIEIEHREDFEFVVRFDWPGVPDLALDEPAPVGGQTGPSASRLVAAAVGNCLSASLLFCLHKARVEPAGLRTRVEGTMTRNDHGRLRLGGFHVMITLDAGDVEAQRVRRCLDLFEDFCVVTESVRHGVAVDVEVVGPDGRPFAAD
jgi:uncharacterized OsmC-like protein